jgi:hypothetical protein
MTYGGGNLPVCCINPFVRLHIAVGGALRLEFFVHRQQDIANLNHHHAHYDDR